MVTKKLNRFEPRSREVTQSILFCMNDTISETDHQAVYFLTRGRPSQLENHKFLRRSSVPKCKKCIHKLKVGACSSFTNASGAV